LHFFGSNTAIMSVAISKICGYCTKEPSQGWIIPAQIVWPVMNTVSPIWS
jgi:hypothetical protein